MKASVTIIVPTYGSDEWKVKAQNAVESAKNQSLEAEVVRHIHSDSLGLSRNIGGFSAHTEWLIFLDADDELDYRYVESMMEPNEGEKQDDIRQPRTLGIYSDGTQDETANIIPAAKSLIQRNHLVIGSMCRTKAFNEVGGFDVDLPALEDWDLWLKMDIAGYQIGVRPNAIYRVGVNQGSRNSPKGYHNVAARKIRNRYVRHYG